MAVQVHTSAEELHEEFFSSGRAATSSLHRGKEWIGRKVFPWLKALLIVLPELQARATRKGWGHVLALQ